MNSPFKFLDAYTREDRAIFFGRDREIEGMYQKVFESKILLIYGISGTGKTSLINCGLANKFEDTDWLPVNVRRGFNVVDSLWKELGKVAITTVMEEQKGERERGTKGRREGGKEGMGEGEKEGMGEGVKGRIVKALKSIYLDHFKPIYLIFDQFEELFIFGSREEREEFIQIVKEVVDSDIQCKFIFSIREEYLAGVTEFELTIPDFLSNRMRIEKMTWKNAIQVIEEPCKVHGIEVEEGFAEALLNKLNPEGKEVELTYLQVFLDKVYRLVSDQENKPKSPPLQGGDLEGGEVTSSQGTRAFRMTHSLLERVGDVSDLLGSFLEEQISVLEDPEMGLTTLKAFVSVKGTKRQITEEQVVEFSKTLGKPVQQKYLTELIQRFVNLRILRDKDESNRYELRHDSLAAKIYEKITLVEKELLDVRQFIEDAFQNYEKRKVLLSDKDLKYLQVYEDRLFLESDLKEFLELSKKTIYAKRKQFNTILRISLIGFILLLAGIGVYYYRSVSEIRRIEKATKSLLQSEQVPELSFRTALEAYKMDTASSIAHFAILNSFYSLLDKGKYYDTIKKTYYDPYKLIFDFKPCHTDIRSAAFSDDGRLIYGWLDDNTVKVWDIHGKELQTITRQEHSIITVSLSNNNEFIAIVLTDSTGSVWRVSREKIFDFPVAINPVYNKKVMDFSPDNRFLAVAGLEQNINIYELNGTVFQQLSGHKDRINCLSFSPDSRFLASASDDKSVMIWNYNRNTNLFGSYDTIQGHWRAVRSCNFSHNSNYILTAADDSMVAIWDLNGKRVFRHSLSDYTSMKFPHEKPCNAEFTEDEKLIIITRYRQTNNDSAGNNIMLTNGNFIYTQTLINETDYYYEYINPLKNKMVWQEVGGYYDLDKEVRFLDYNPGDRTIAVEPTDTSLIILMSHDLLPLKSFKGTLPVYSLTGDYLLYINGVELYLYPVSVSEIIRLVEKVQIFGRLNYEMMDWVPAF